MTAPVIKTPRGQIIIGPNGKAELTFNANFQSKWQGRFSRAQVFVDSEVLRLSEPYTPKLTGMLIDSGTLGTELGSGRVKYIAPYSRRQYYAKRKPGSQTGPLRGPLWFYRMKLAHGRSIVSGARKYTGGR